MQLGYFEKITTLSFIDYICSGYYLHLRYLLRRTSMCIVGNDLVYTGENA